MDQKYIERAETYLRGNLAESDRKNFERDLASDPELKLAFDQCRLAMDVVDRQVEIDLSSKFRHWGKEKDSGRSHLMSLAWKIAASVAVIIGVYFILFQRSPTLSHQQLALKFYQTPPAPDRTMGGEDRLWAKGIEAYQQQQYRVAIDNWSRITRRTPEVSYFLANAYFNNMDYQSAILIFKDLSEGGSIYSFRMEPCPVVFIHWATGTL